MARLNEAEALKIVTEAGYIIHLFQHLVLKIMSGEHHSEELDIERQLVIPASLAQAGRLCEKGKDLSSPVEACEAIIRRYRRLVNFCGKVDPSLSVSSFDVERFPSRPSVDLLEILYALSNSSSVFRGDPKRKDLKKLLGSLLPVAYIAFRLLRSMRASAVATDRILEMARDEDQISVALNRLRAKYVEMALTRNKDLMEEVKQLCKEVFDLVTEFLEKYQINLGYSFRSIEECALSSNRIDARNIHTALVFRSAFDFFVFEHPKEADPNDLEYYGELIEDQLCAVAWLYSRLSSKEVAEDPDRFLASLTRVGR